VYYWITITGLLFLPLCLFGTGYFAWQIIHSIASPVTRPAYGNFDHWLSVAIGGVICWFIGRSILKGYKNFIKPISKIEGVIMDKEEREYQDGRHYYLLLKSNDKIQINEKSYSKLNRGNQIIVLWSNKIDSAMKIVRVNTAES
jgi:hypothetical protein